MNNYFRVFKFSYFKCNFLDYTCPIRLVWALFFIWSLLCAFSGFLGVLVAFLFFLFSVFLFLLLFCLVFFLFCCVFVHFVFLFIFCCCVFVGHCTVLLWDIVLFCYIYFFCNGYRYEVGICIFIFIVVVWLWFLSVVYGEHKKHKKHNFFLCSLCFLCFFLYLNSYFYICVFVFVELISEKGFSGL